MPGTTQAVTTEAPPDFGMRVLTRDLDGWADAWLVELDEPISVVLKTYEDFDSGIRLIDEVAVVRTRHVVVNHEVVHEHYAESLVYPAFASGEARRLGDEAVPIAGGDACTHVDALHDLAAGYTGLECTVEGERCQYAMGMNQVILHE